MKKLHTLSSVLAVLAGFAAAPPPVPLADHGDTPLLISAMRHDVRITDLFAFTRGADLVLIVCTDPTVPPELTDYVFPSDLRIDIAIDNDSPVGFDDPFDLAEFGGTLLDPEHVEEDLLLRIRFDSDGEPILRMAGRRSFRPGLMSSTRLFAGLRDDPFIRGPRIGRNVAAVVVELPLAEVLGGQDTLLIWATAKASGLGGPFQELAGRSLRNQFPENDALNTLRPRDHYRVLGVVPDVVVFDTSRPASYPNGRELTDDVVDLVGDPRPLANDAPFPDANDVPFLSAFPYLAPPQ